MLINTTKTMLITTYQKRISLIHDQLSIHLSNVKQNLKMNDKALGIIIDNDLTWSQHVYKVSKMWLLARSKDHQTTSQRIQFYKTYIKPHTDYCNTVWGYLK